MNGSAKGSKMVPFEQTLLDHVQSWMKINVWSVAQIFSVQNFALRVMFGHSIKSIKPVHQIWCLIKMCDLL